MVNSSSNCSDDMQGRRRLPGNPEHEGVETIDREGAVDESPTSAERQLVEVAVLGKLS